MNLIESALQEVAKGPDELNAWLVRHPEALEPNFVEQSSNYALEAMQHGALHNALAASMLSTTIHMHQGDRKKAIRSKVQEVEVLYMLADNEDAYQFAFELASTAADHAAEVNSPDVVFWALSLAADSAYWASTTVANPGRKRWLGATVDTLLRIGAVPAVDDAPGPWSRFVSCLVATYQTITQENWGAEQDAVDANLRNLAALAERLVPLNFSFDDPKKTEHVAYHLSALSANYGNRASADARRRASQQAVKKDEWNF